MCFALPFQLFKRNLVQKTNYPVTKPIVSKLSINLNKHQMALASRVDEPELARDVRNSIG